VPSLRTLVVSSMLITVSWHSWLTFNSSLMVTVEEHIHFKKFFKRFFIFRLMWEVHKFSHKIALTDVPCQRFSDTFLQAFYFKSLNFSSFSVSKRDNNLWARQQATKKQILVCWHWYKGPAEWRKTFELLWKVINFMETPINRNATRWLMIWIASRRKLPVLSVI